MSGVVLRRKNNFANIRVFAILIVFLLSLLLVISVISQEENSSVTADSALNESVLDVLDLVINESGLNESFSTDVGLNETIPSYFGLLSPPPPSGEVIEGNETIAQVGLNETLNESGSVILEAPKAPELNVSVNETLSFDLNESINLSDSNTTLNLSSLSENVSLNLSLNDSNSSRNDSIPLPEPIRPERSVRRIMAGDNRDILSNSSRITISIVGVSQKADLAFIKVGGDVFIVRSGENYTFGDQTFRIERIQFMPFRGAPVGQVEVSYES